MAKLYVVPIFGYYIFSHELRHDMQSKRVLMRCRAGLRRFAKILAAVGGTLNDVAGARLLLFVRGRHSTSGWRTVVSPPDFRSCEYHLRG